MLALSRLRDRGLQSRQAIRSVHARATRWHLLPNATQESRHRVLLQPLLETTEEGGAQPKEYIVKYESIACGNIHRVDAATMGCCSVTITSLIHNQKDFYSMAHSSPTCRKRPSAVASRA